MISDILKALDLLLKALPGLKAYSKEKRKEKIAKSLLRLYLDLDQLVSTGSELLDDISDQEFVEKEHWYETSSHTIEKQLRALGSIADTINEEPLHSILAIYIRPVAEIPGVFEGGGKGSELRFLLAALTDMKFASAEKLEEIEGGPTEWYSLEAAISMSQTEMVSRTTTSVYALPEHIKKATQTLSDISQRQEQLRSFIADKFELKDLI